MYNVEPNEDGGSEVSISNLLLRPETCGSLLVNLNERDLEDPLVLGCPSGVRLCNEVVEVSC